MTNDKWFCLFTTFVGMLVINTWLLCQQSIKNKEDDNSKSKIVDFAGKISESLLDMVEEFEEIDAP